MRRLTLAALAGVLILAGCSDQAKQSPTEPSAVPEQNLTSCRPVKFPVVAATGLIKQVFPVRLRVEALARVAAIALLWDACKVDLARKGVASFIDWMNGKSSSLTPGSDTQRNALVSLLFTGVGLTVPPGTTLGPDFGIGTVDPKATTPTKIETEGNTGLIEFQPAGGGRPAAFDQLTVVTVTRKPDGFHLDGFPEEDQFPPFFEYTASNTANNHKIADGAVARMAFCLLDLASLPNGYPDGARIGHNPDASLQPPLFEIIPADEHVAEYVDDLSGCFNFPSVGAFGGGLLSVGNVAGRLFTPLVRSLFVAQPIVAMTVGTRGPLGGLPPSLSPFGVVNATSYFGYEDGEAAWTNGGSFWNRRDITPLTNSAFPTYVSTFDAPGVLGGTVPQPFRKSSSGWYGQISTGNYIGTQAGISESDDPSGGTSTAPNSGSYVSPEVDIPEVASSVQLKFKTWWEIEGQNPSGFDQMTIEIVENGNVLAQQTLNPSSDPGPSSENRHNKPFTSNGYNTAPGWKDVSLDLSSFKGRIVRIRFVFTTGDVLYNGFRGWLVDDVRISTGTSTSQAPSQMMMELERSGTPLTPAEQRPPRTRP